MLTKVAKLILLNIFNKIAYICWIIAFVFSLYYCLKTIKLLFKIWLVGTGIFTGLHLTSLLFSLAMCRSILNGGSGSLLWVRVRVRQILGAGRDCWRTGGGGGGGCWSRLLTGGGGGGAGRDCWFQFITTMRPGASWSANQHGRVCEAARLHADQEWARDLLFFWHPHKFILYKSGPD